MKTFAQFQSQQSLILHFLIIFDVFRKFARSYFISKTTWLSGESPIRLKQKKYYERRVPVSDTSCLRGT